MVEDKSLTHLLLVPDWLLDVTTAWTIPNTISLFIQTLLGLHYCSATKARFPEGHKRSYRVGHKRSYRVGHRSLEAPLDTSYASAAKFHSHAQWLKVYFSFLHQRLAAQQRLVKLTLLQHGQWNRVFHSVCQVWLSSGPPGFALLATAHDCETGFCFCFCCLFLFATVFNLMVAMPKGI